MVMKRVALVLMFIAAIAMVGCASRQSSEYYTRGQAQKMQTVLIGEIISVRDVTIEGTKTPAGTVVGALIGGILGSAVGRGKGAQIATVVGATAGALGGSKVEEEVTKKPGYELTIKLDTGDVVSIVQEADIPFRVGDKVRVNKGRDGLAKVAPL